MFTNRLRNKTLVLAPLLGIHLIITGCANDPVPARRASLIQGGIESASEHVLAPYGVPELRAGFTQPPTTPVERDGWLALHSDLDLIPLWVCQRLDSADTVGDADRDDCSWRSDPQLTGPRATDADYTNSGYARGHMAPANDYSFSQDEICETFFFTNCVPQIQNGFNSGIWSTLEARCQDAAVARDSVFIITGPMFYDPLDDDTLEGHDPALDDDTVEYFVVGANRVAVPTHLYKIIVDATDVDDPSAICFVFENRRHTNKRGSDGPRFTDRYVRSIDWLEDRTGIDFLPLLDEAIDDPDAFEAAPANLADWPEFQPR